jgi:putative heme-binding domain-containing protein
VQTKGAKRLPKFDLAELSTSELVDQLDSPSGWHRTTARRLLAGRNDSQILQLLTDRLASPSSQVALESLWTLATLNALDETRLVDLLKHPQDAVRAWAVRLLGDRKSVAFETARILLTRASDKNAAVRSQLACTAQRLPGEQALPLVFALAHNDIDVQDLQIPLLLWWALERHADDREQILNWLNEQSHWQQPLLRQHLIGRLARRYAARGKTEDLLTAGRLLAIAPDAQDRERVARGMNLGFRGRRITTPPSELAAAFGKLKEDPQSLAILELGLRIGDEESKRHAMQLIVQEDTPLEKRANLIAVLGEIAIESATPALLRLLASSDTLESVRLAALSALARSEEMQVSEAILMHYESLPRPLKPRAIEVLAARPTSAAKLVGSVQAGLIPQSDVAQDHLRQLAAHHDAALDAAVTRLWGKVRAATPEERLAVIRRLNNDLRADSGNSAGGKVLFNEHCAKCHRLHGEGNQVGPDLTTANRSDREFLLVSLVDPSANVRKEYLNQVVQMTDGRILTGIVVEETDAEVTLLDANNQRQRLVKSDIEELKPAENSLMPEGLLEKLSPGQLRDLFSYLQQTSSAK